MRYVNDRLERLKPDSVLTMTIVQGLSADSYVLTVIEELWADTVRKSVQNSLKQPTNTSPESTPAG